MTKFCKKWTGLALVVGCAALCIAAADQREPSVGEWADVLNLGASFSVYSYGQAPFNRAAPFLGFEQRLRFSHGAEAFASGVPATASANASSCGSCHFKNGRGRSHSDDFAATGFSVINRVDDGAPPVFRQPADSDVGAARLADVRWAPSARIVLTGGETVELVRPVALVDGVERAVDLRNAPAAHGLGLLESIPDADIVAFARARPYEAFGITGLVPIAADGKGSRRVGRFGWKGKFATLPGQVRAAAASELGIGSGAEDTGAGDTGAGDSGAGDSGAGDPELAALVTKLVDYLRFLAVPARRLGGEGSYRHGARVFVSTGCAMCHVPSQRTGRTADLPEPYRDLIIFPFTDMLLHDLGPGLSDLSATELSRHWRTAPLWGIGVQHGVSPDVGFLHDGRARTLTEAILWHGGEARLAVDRFKQLPPEERAELIAFLASL